MQLLLDTDQIITYREPRGIEEEIRAIEAVEPTKVVGISINLKNAELD